MQQYGAAYVFLTTGGPGCEASVDFATSPLFEEAYANRTVRIFRLSSAP
jgi:hypothetical protein